METARAGAAFSVLRSLGASTDEAVAVILTVDEVDRAIELASPAWLREARGPGGKWESRVATTTEAAKAAEIRPHAIKAAAKMAAHAQQQSSMVAQEHAHQAMMHLNKQIQDANKLDDEQEKKKSKVKFRAMAASLIGGAAIGYIEARMGAPDLAQLVSAVAPALAESFFERQKEL